jgi:hypothetical protein
MAVPTYCGFGAALEMSMEPLAYAGSSRGSASVGASPNLFRSLAWLGGGLATIAALGVAAVLAVFFAATMVVIGLMATALIGLGGLAYRARRSFKSAQPDDPTLLEARHIGGHSWVAYSWDQRGR